MSKQGGEVPERAKVHCPVCRADLTELSREAIEAVRPQIEQHFIERLTSPEAVEAVAKRRYGATQGFSENWEQRWEGFPEPTRERIRKEARAALQAVTQSKEGQDHE